MAYQHHYADGYGADYGTSSPGHNSDFAMQKYLLLQSQHEELRQHMHDLCPTYSHTTSSTAVTSPSVSPTRGFSISPSHSKSTSPSPIRHSHRRSSAPQSARSGRTSYSLHPLAPVLDEELVTEMEADEQKLSDVNEGIKRALTELLNCDAVRGDRSMRTWVQTRLMDAERELRTGRSGRRRRSHCTD